MGPLAVETVSIPSVRIEFGSPFPVEGYLFSLDPRGREEALPQMM